MSTHKTLIKATLLFAILSVLQPLSNFLLLPVYTKYFGTANFGLLSILNNISVFFFIISGLNIGTSIIAFYKNYKTEEALKRFIGNVISFSFYVNVGILAIFMLWGNGFSRLIFDQQVEFYPNIFYTIFFGLFSTTAIAYFNFLKFEKQLKTFTLLSVIQFIILIAIQFFFVVNLKRGLTGAMEAKALTTGLVLVIVLYSLRKQIFRRLAFKTDILPSLKYAMHFGPAAFISWIGQYSDRSIIERYIHDGMFTLGKYSMVATVCAIVDIGIIALNSAIQPYIFDSFVEKNNVATKNYYKIFLAATILITSAVIVIGTNMQFMIRDAGLASSLVLIPLMGCGFVFSGFAIMYGLQISYSQRSPYFVFVYGTAMLSNLVLNIILIKPLGIYGVIVAGVASKIFMALSMLYFAEKCSHSEAWKNLLMNIVFSMAIIIFCWFLFYFNIVSILSAVLLQFAGNILLVLTFIKPRILIKVFSRNRPQA